MPEIEGRLYRLINRVVILVLRSPLHAVLSGGVLLLRVAGRRSGRLYTVPLSYVRGADSVVCFTGPAWSAWWKNLRGGARVTVRMRGRDLTGTGLVVTEEGVAVEGLETFLGAFPSTARRYSVKLDTNGRPDRGGIETAVRTGVAVMILMEPDDGTVGGR